MATRRSLLVCVALAVMLAPGLTACGSSTLTSTGASPSIAGDTSPDTATGGDFLMKTDVTCTPSHEQEVTWTLLNTGPELEVISAKVDGAARAEPVFSPSPITKGQSTVGILTVPGGLQGDIDLRLTLSFGSPVTTGGMTQLQGNC